VSTKTIIAIVVIIALAGAGWWYRDSATLQGAAISAQSLVKDALPDNSYSVVKVADDKSAGKVDRAKGAQPLKKCVSEGRTVYTDEKCPTGTREAPISEGNVTVVPGQRPAEKPKKSEEKAK
jgi:hypothetical protein